MKKYAYELMEGNVVTSLVLDPPGDFIVDYVFHDEDNALVKVEGYIEGSGDEFSFIWGDDKVLTTR